MYVRMYVCHVKGLEMRSHALIEYPCYGSLQFSVTNPAADSLALILLYFDCNKGCP